LTRIPTNYTLGPSKLQTLHGKYYIAGRVICKFQPNIVLYICSTHGFFMSEAAKTLSVLMQATITFFNRHVTSGKIMNLRIKMRWTWVLGECL